MAQGADRLGLLILEPHFSGSQLSCHILYIAIVPALQSKARDFGCHVIYHRSRFAVLHSAKSVPHTTLLPE
jgi:hypothetical protein